MKINKNNLNINRARKINVLKKIKITGKTLFYTVSAIPVCLSNEIRCEIPAGGYVYLSNRQIYNNGRGGGDTFKANK